MLPFMTLRCFLLMISLVQSDIIWSDTLADYTRNWRFERNALTVTVPNPIYPNGKNYGVYAAVLYRYMLKIPIPTTNYHNVTFQFSYRIIGSVKGNTDFCALQYTLDGSMVEDDLLDIVRWDRTATTPLDDIGVFSSWIPTPNSADDNNIGIYLKIYSGSSTDGLCYFNDFIISGDGPTTAPTPLNLATTTSNPTTAPTPSDPAITTSNPTTPPTPLDPATTTAPTPLDQATTTSNPTTAQSQISVTTSDPITNTNTEQPTTLVTTTGNTTATIPYNASDAATTGSTTNHTNTDEATALETATANTTSLKSISYTYGPSQSEYGVRITVTIDEDIEAEDTQQIIAILMQYSLDITKITSNCDENIGIESERQNNVLIINAVISSCDEESQNMLIAQYDGTLIESDIIGINGAQVIDIEISEINNYDDDQEEEGSEFVLMDKYGALGGVIGGVCIFLCILIVIVIKIRQNNIYKSNVRKTEMDINDDKEIETETVVTTKSEAQTATPKLKHKPSVSQDSQDSEGLYALQKGGIMELEETKGMPNKEKGEGTELEKTKGVTLTSKQTAAPKLKHKPSVSQDSEDSEDSEDSKGLYALQKGGVMELEETKGMSNKEKGEGTELVQTKGVTAEALSEDKRMDETEVGDTIEGDTKDGTV